VSKKWGPLQFRGSLRPDFVAPLKKGTAGFAVSAAGLLMFSLSIAFSLIEFLLAASCGRHSDHSGWEKHQAQSVGAIGSMKRMPERLKGKWRERSPFYVPTKRARAISVNGDLVDRADSLQFRRLV
jgi:hypothetical protein